MLRRELTDKERTEFLELAGAIGMGNVEDFLFMLMIFKRNEDRITGQLISFKKEMQGAFEKMGVFEKKIDEKLEATIRNMLGTGAEQIARSMADTIAWHANRELQQYEEYHFLRGQTTVLTITAILMAVAYELGTVKILEDVPVLLAVPLRFPSGGLAFLGLSVYAILWWYGRVEDRFRAKPRSLFWDRTTLVIMVLILLCIVIAFMGGM